MANQGNILSYDEVRKADRPRSSVASSKVSPAKPRKRTSFDSRAKTSKAPQSGPAASPSRRSVKAAQQKPAQKVAPKPTQKSTQKPSAAKQSTTTKQTTRAGAKSVPSSARQSRPPAKGTKKNSVAQKPVPKQSAAKPPATRQASSKARPTSDTSRLEKAKKDHLKKKAGKSFTKQFEDTSTSSAHSSSRAAVYKGEMGRAHKRSFALQGNETSRKRSSGIASLIVSRFTFRKSPKSTVLAMGVACLVMSVMFLYPAAQQYYVTVRENEQVQAEYAAILQRNENIQNQIDQLNTTQGIEDKAREELGWVKQGEQSGTVFGLEGDASKPDYVESIPAGSVEAPQSWYSPVLDFIFDYN